MVDLENPDFLPFPITIEWGNEFIQLDIVHIWDNEKNQTEFSVFLRLKELGIIHRDHSDVFGWEWLNGELEGEKADLIGDEIDNYYM